MNIIAKLVRMYLNFEYRAYLDYVTKRVARTKDWKRYYELNMRLFDADLGDKEPSINDFLDKHLAIFESDFDTLTISEMWRTARRFRNEDYRYHTFFSIWEAVASADPL